MVLFDNIVLGQTVEVLWKGQVRQAKVRYRGRLNGEEGNWVGLELLNGLLNGYSDGRFAGRTYFACEDGRGIFTTANMVRFIRSERKSFDAYQSIGSAEVDETLFGKSRGASHSSDEDRPLKSKDSKQILVTREYCESLFRNTLGRQRLTKQATQFRLSQFCGRHVGSAPLRKHIAIQKAEAEKVQSSVSAYDARRQRESQHFITPATISQSYLPFSMQRRDIDKHKHSAFACRNGQHTPSVQLTYDFQDYSH